MQVSATGHPSGPMGPGQLFSGQLDGQTFQQSPDFMGMQVEGGGHFSPSFHGPGQYISSFAHFIGGGHS